VVLRDHVGHVQDRVDVWLTRSARLSTAAAYQIANGCSRRPTAGCSGPARRVAAAVPDGAPLIPAPQTDLIYAVIVNELGLVGGVRADLVYLLLAERGFKIATLAATRSPSCSPPG
jgi:cell division protein FtsW (lipid II flippase)